MHPGLHYAYPSTAVLLLLILPGGSTPVLLALVVATILAAALMLSQQTSEPATVVPFGGDAATLALMRRTVPALRSRRPAATIEAQVRWRQAAETRRQFRIVS